MTALGSGKIFGRGIGLGPQSQLHFLPASRTDFLISAIGEENEKGTYKIKKKGTKRGWVPVVSLTPPEEFKLKDVGSTYKASMGGQVTSVKG